MLSHKEIDDLAEDKTRAILRSMHIRDDLPLTHWLCCDRFIAIKIQYVLRGLIEELQRESNLKDMLITELNARIDRARSELEIKPMTISSN